MNSIAIGISLNFETSQLFDGFYQNTIKRLNNLKNLLLTKIGERYGITNIWSQFIICII
jgi:hypothetical protein